MLASSNRPASRLSRTRVLLIGSPFQWMRGTLSTDSLCFAASVTNRFTSPFRPAPNRQFSPT